MLKHHLFWLLALFAAFTLVAVGCDEGDDDDTADDDTADDDAADDDTGDDDTGDDDTSDENCEAAELSPSGEGHFAYTAGDSDERHSYAIPEGIDHIVAT